MKHPYYDKSKILTELGWTRVYETSDGNSEHSSWAPIPNGPCGDIYVFEGYHMNMGSHLYVVWSDTLEEADKLVGSTENGIPCFYPNTEDELRVILTCAIG